MKKREVLVQDGVAIVPLTKGRVAIADAELACNLGECNWQNNGPYAYRRMWIGGRKSSISMHRFVLSLAGIVVPEGLGIDHINRDGLDNRLSNLRIVEHSENMRNRRLRIGVSGYRGVIRCKKRWAAVLSRNNTQYRIGIFDTPLEAAIAYDAAAKEFGGTYTLNFPESVEGK